MILAACLTLSGMFTVYASTDETDPACAADFADDVDEMDAVCLDDEAVEMDAVCLDDEADEMGAVCLDDEADEMDAVCFDDEAVDAGAIYFAEDPDTIISDDETDNKDDMIPEDASGLYDETSDIGTLAEEGSILLSSDDPAASIVVDEAHFPDASFRSWVQQNLCSDPASPVLSYAERMAVKTLEISDDSIQSLAGIGLFPGLEALVIESTALDTLPLSQNEALTSLTVKNNISLRTVELSENAPLRELTLEGVGLSDLSGLLRPSLQLLTVSDCVDVQTLDLSGCPFLSRVSILGNRSLASIDLSGCLLDFVSDKVSSIDRYTGFISDNPSLGTLDFSGSSISSLEILQTPLKELRLQNSNATDITLGKVSVSALEALNINGCSSLSMIILADDCSADEKQKLAVLGVPEALCMFSSEVPARITAMTYPSEQYPDAGAFSAFLDELSVLSSSPSAAADLQSVTIDLTGTGTGQAAGIAGLDLSAFSRLHSLTVWGWASLERISLPSPSSLHYVELVGTGVTSLRDLRLQSVLQEFILADSTAAIDTLDLSQCSALSEVFLGSEDEGRPASIGTVLFSANAPHLVNEDEAAQAAQQGSSLLPSFLNLIAAVSCPENAASWQPYIGSSFGGKDITWTDYDPQTYDAGTGTYISWEKQYTIDREPDCTVPGQKSIHSTDGLHVLESSITAIPALGHSFGKAVTVSEPTAVKEGTTVSRCTRAGCDGVKHGTIPKLKGTGKLNVTKIPLKVRQSASCVSMTGMAKGDYIISWSSRQPKIASVTNTGKITGKKAGTAYITVTLASGFSRVLTVKVQKKEVKTKKITGVPKKCTVTAGKTLSLKPVLSPLTSLQKITYTSSNKKVASVSKKGVIKGRKKGKAVITIRSGKKKVRCRVTVN